MDIDEAISKRRTIRRFQKKPVPSKVLEMCVDAARVAPSARNVQELEFVAVDDSEKVSRLNSAVRFGGIVAKEGRVKGEEAKAFIIIVSEDARASPDYTAMNAGIAAEAIALTAWSKGVGCCPMGAIDREKIKEVLSIPAGHCIQLAIALGYPAEKPVIEDAEATDMELDYRVEAGQLHIPKRPLEKVLHRNRF